MSRRGGFFVRGRGSREIIHRRVRNLNRRERDRGVFQSLAWTEGDLRGVSHGRDTQRRFEMRRRVLGVERYRGVWKMNSWKRKVKGRKDIGMQRR
uniref:Putative ovule protein n=1 Tax=Solanum chacoense TaxID=4108 RepID=A0A0V0GNX4_SOLCH